MGNKAGPATTPAAGATRAISRILPAESTTKGSAPVELCISWRFPARIAAWVAGEKATWSDCPALAAEETNALTGVNDWASAPTALTLEVIRRPLEAGVKVVVDSRIIHESSPGSAISSPAPDCLHSSPLGPRSSAVMASEDSGERCAARLPTRLQRRAPYEK